MKLEIERLRLGLQRCAERAGEDVSGGIPTQPEVVEWAVSAVTECRKEQEDSYRELEQELLTAKTERDRNADVAEGLAERIHHELDDHGAYVCAMDELQTR